MISSDMLASALSGASVKVELRGWRSMEIAHIVCDSRGVAPGDVYVAISGVATDGHRFVQDALRAGAVACVVERMLPELEGVPTALVSDSRIALAYLHAAVHGYPARRLKIIGVTGTDGKTTTVRLIAGILRAAGRRIGSIDTVRAAIGDDQVPTGFHTTTPDAPEIQAYLSQMVHAGVEYAVLESTSHGLAQQRVAACEFDVAVVTNITHDHLDYHGTYEAYREAKATLFRALDTSLRKPNVPKVAVLNEDDRSSCSYLRAIPAELRIGYGLYHPADVTATQVQGSPSGLTFTAHVQGTEIPITSPLVGRFNVYNILAAVSVAHSQGIGAEAIRTGVAEVPGVRGRMERIDRGQPFTVIVDFAHTPNALENALSTARGLARREVTVVFGCAGLRDRAKRPWMGEIAGRLADNVVITAEDPRTESLDEITDQIAAGSLRSGRTDGRGVWRIAERSEAIAFALERAQPGDLVIVTGKGHEQSMCFGTTEYPWSDHEAVLEGLSRLGFR